MQTTDGGSLLLRKADQKINLTKRVSKIIKDNRNNKKKHSIISMLRQRIYGLCLGCSDLNDRDTFRQDIGLQTAVGRDEVLASSPTLCRFENKMKREAAWPINQIMVETFLQSLKKPPEEIIQSLCTIRIRYFDKDKISSITVGSY